MVVSVSAVRSRDVSGVFRAQGRRSGILAQVTISETFDPRRNSMNLLRLLMAAAVIVSHAWPVRGESSPEPQFGDVTLGSWAVAGFFVLSGFLITRSRERRTTWEYVRDRTLRIYPAFLVCTVLIAFVVAPASLLFTQGQSWSASGASDYILTNLPLGGGFSFRHDSVGTTLDGEPVEVWNGATWTLIYEAACYVWIAVAIGVVPRRLLGPALLAALALLALLAQASLWVDGAPKAAYDVGHMFGAFCIGALCWLYRDRVPVGHLAAVVAVVALILLCLAGFGRSLALIPFSVLLFYLSWLVPLDQLGAHDFSYGLYLWGWPTQQFVMLVVGASVAMWLNIALVIAICSMLGWASAVWVEEPARHTRPSPTRARV